jgi:hypothetical protein
MPKHILDRQAPDDGTRAERFAEIERQSRAEGSHPAAKTLVRRPRLRDDGRKLGEFVRVERGAQT